MESFFQDLRYALRAMRRAPGFTAIAVVSLALGIGANTAIFSLIDAVMLRSLPVRDPGQLVELLSQYPGEPRMNSFSWKYYEHFRDRNHVFSSLTGVSRAQFEVRVDGQGAETVDGDYVLGDFFPTLGVEAAIGRLIGPEDRQAVAVVSWSYWNKRFALDPAILGKRIVVDDVPLTVVGVARREFFGLDAGSRKDIWVPVASLKDTGDLSLMLVGRLRPGVSMEHARGEMRTLDRPRVEEFVKENKDPLWSQLRLDVEPAGSGTSRVRDLFAQPLLILMAIVVLLLMIACTNVGGLLLARGAARQQEIAVRNSLGAGRFRLARQVLTESLLISSMGAGLGVFVAWWGAGTLARVVASARVLVPISIQIEPDLRMLLFASGAALVSGLFFGLLPALYAFRSAPASSLRAGAGGGATKLRRLFGNGLVVAQVALSVVLLSAAGLFAGHLARLRGPDLGFNSNSVLLVSVDSSQSGYTRPQLSALSEELLYRVKAIPGVRSATLAAGTPISGGGEAHFAKVEGYEERAEDRRYVMFSRVAPDYFATLGIPLLAGRDFVLEDKGRTPVAIVNQAMARHYFPNGNPIGKHLTFDGTTGEHEIVGMVGDAKYETPGEVAPRTIYLNTFQDRRVGQNLVLRTAAAPTAIVSAVRRVVSDTLKNVEVGKVTTLAAQVDASIVRERLIATLSELFAVLGVTLTALGLYGLLAFTVARRIHEIGIRMALGASRSAVTSMVLKSALGLVCAGLVLGAPVAIWSKQIASNWLQGFAANTTLFPIAFAAAAMIAIALIAAYIPARRAARVNPLEALRHD